MGNCFVDLAAGSLADTQRVAMCRHAWVVVCAGLLLAGCGGEPTAACTWYQDADGDGYGDPGVSIEVCGSVAGYVANGDDCDDGNDLLHPETEWHQDADGDGYGGVDVAVTQCGKPDGDHVLDSSDCNDADGAIHPESIWYLDEDQDGYGVSAVSVTQCRGPADHVLVAGDCNDGDDTLHPGTTWGYDMDGDGHGNPAMTRVECEQPAGYVLGTTDCDDSDANEHPGQIWHPDFDQDGSGNPGATTVACEQPADHVLDGRDCNDQDATVYIGQGNCPYQPADATSCLDILIDGNSEGDGGYVIDPDGAAGPAAAITVFCDMTTDGGGWTALVNPTGYGFAARGIPDLALSGQYTGGVGESCVPNTPVLADYGNGWFSIHEYTCGDRATRYHVHWPNTFGATDVRFVATAQGISGTLQINGTAIPAGGSITNGQGMVCRFWNGTNETFTPSSGFNDCHSSHPDFAPKVMTAAFTGLLDLDIEVGRACFPSCSYGVGMNLYKLFVR